MQSILDEEVIPQETWETWGTHGESHKPQKVGDKWYLSSNVGISGTPLKASQWAPLMLTGQVKPISVKGYKTIVLENSIEEV